MSPGEAWKPPADGSYQKCAGKLAESAQLALKAEEYKDMIPINAAGSISNNHNQEGGIDNTTTYSAATTVSDGFV